MIESYNGGYKKALLDLKVFIEDWKTIDEECKTKKQYKAMLLSLLNLLLTNPEELDNFKCGLWVFMMNRETKEIKGTCKK